MGVPFSIQDPFGLRRAIVPVFRRSPDGSTLGLGTAFSIDGWGGMITADHVVDHSRALHLREIMPNALISADASRSSHSAILLGYGLAFGTVVIPAECWAPIVRIDAIVDRHDDPIAELRGDSPYRIAADVAGLTAALHPKAPAIRSLALDLRWRPSIGEIVFAVGYPELDFKAMRPDEVKEYLSEGMFGVYGAITNIFPIGRDKTRPTPVFEVEADWRSGMSGGPVFNQHGRVIGVVSYSLPPSADSPGMGYAACLGLIPEMPGLIPTVDANNPAHRLGFAVYRSTPWALECVKPTREDAELVRAKLGADYAVAWGAHRLGSDEFITLSEPGLSR
jgi:serine protease Do